MRMLKVVLSVSAMVFSGSATADNRVVSGTLTLMDGPGKIYRPVQSMASGTRVELLESYEGWGLIRLPSGVTGWAAGSRLVRPGAYTRAAAPVDIEKYTSVVWPPEGNLNLRAGPGLGHDVKMVMARGDIVEVFQKAGKWAHVRCITGEVGWTYAGYLSR